MIQLTLADVIPAVMEANAPPAEAGGEPRKLKVLSFTDPQTGIAVQIPLTQERAKELGEHLITDKHIAITEALPGNERVPDLGKLRHPES